MSDALLRLYATAMDDRFNLNEGNASSQKALAVLVYLQRGDVKHIDGQLIHSAYVQMSIYRMSCRYDISSPVTA
jgi:hypothetical protein